MATQTKQPRKAAVPPSGKAKAQSAEDAAIRMSDGYSNPLARLGMDQPNVLAASRYTTENITQDRELLKALYRGSWLAKKIVDIPAEDMTKNWYKLKSQIDPACVDQLKALEMRHGIKDEMTTGLKWARLFGGGGALMVLKGQEDILDQPLDMSLIMPGDFKGLIVVDRWNLQPFGDLVADMEDPDFGLPEYYQINVDAWRSSYVKVHHSRILRFTGRKLPAEDEAIELYWGASEFEHIFEELNKRNATSANIAQLIFQANLRVWKNDDFGEFMGSASKEQVSRLRRAVLEQNRLATSFGMQMVGSKDTYETHQYTFSGISDVYETFMLDMSGAADMPATKLFGRAPQGMNSTGESDQDNYYESLGKNQENQLRPALERLLPVMAMSLWGAVPDDMSLDFEPVRPVSAQERADIGQKNTQTIQGAFTAGMVSQKIALQELREAGRPLGLWTHITDEDIAMANASLEPAGEGMPGMSLGLPGAYGAERPELGNPTKPPVMERS
jgi:phage-related protein (TIGR01555 family)